MLRHKNPKFDDIRAILRRAMEERNPETAAGHFRDALASAEALGVDSASLRWTLAVACDYAGQPEGAFEAIVHALELDPLSEQLLESYDVIASRVRGALADPERAVDDPTTPTLYALLVRYGEADLAAHATMVRYLLAAGDIEKAAGIASALTTLFPVEAAAWACKRDVALAMNDAAAAESASIEMATLASGTWDRGPIN